MLFTTRPLRRFPYQCFVTMPVRKHSNNTTAADRTPATIDGLRRDPLPNLRTNELGRLSVGEG